MLADRLSGSLRFWASRSDRRSASRDALPMFLIVHRTRDGWVPSCPAIVFDSADEARDCIPTLAELYDKPMAAMAVTEHHHSRQLV